MCATAIQLEAADAPRPPASVSSLQKGHSAAVRLALASSLLDAPKACSLVARAECGCLARVRSIVRRIALLLAP
eukprot:COSAG02_NODE_63751_length_262_cov_0.938650_1_plen_73_part_01